MQMNCWLGLHFPTLFPLYGNIYMYIDIWMEYQAYCHLWCFLWLAESESADCFESWCRHLSLPHI